MSLIEQIKESIDNFKTHEEIFFERFRSLVGDAPIHEIKDKTGINPHEIEHWLTDEEPWLPGSYRLAAIAKAYNISIDWLLGLTEEKEPASAATDTSSEVEHETKIVHTHDTTNKGICQEEIAKKLDIIAKCMTTYVYSNLSEAEQKAWDMGEIYAKTCDLQELIKEGLS